MSESELALFTSYLSADELQRAGRFKYPVHQNRFIAGRGLLRGILARYLRCEPAEIGFEYSTFGKPAVRGDAIHFNVAHSEDRFLLAISDQPIGVDIEIRRPMPDTDALAEQVFSLEELSAWKTLDSDSFLRLWTRKEALLKGIGLGIANHVKDVSVFFDNEAPVRVPSALSPERWTIQTFQTEEDIWSIAVPFGAPECLFREHSFDMLRER